MQSGCVLRREDAMEKMKNIRKKLRHQRSVRRRKLGLSTPTQIICVSFFRQPNSSVNNINKYRKILISGKEL